MWMNGEGRRERKRHKREKRENPEGLSEKEEAKKNNARRKFEIKGAARPGWMTSKGLVLDSNPNSVLFN